jgi:uncharacterized membrane protein
MKTKDFLNQIKDEVLVQAIQAAELRSSGEIRVFISRQETQDAVAAAQAHFTRLGMDKTRDRNSVLIFVAPASQAFAVIGDAAIHAKCGQEFWTALAREMTAHFKAGNFTEGLRAGIEHAGQLLAAQFPRQTDDQNELPDQIERD